VVIAQELEGWRTVYNWIIEELLHTLCHLFEVKTVEMNELKRWSDHNFLGLVLWVHINSVEFNWLSIEKAVHVGKSTKRILEIIGSVNIKATIFD